MNRSLVIIGYLVATSVVAQNHLTFPNVEAEFTIRYYCPDPWGNGAYFMYNTYTYSYEPVVEVDSLVWSSVEPEVGLIAIDGDKIFYRGDYSILDDTTIVLYDFALEVGDTAYFDWYCLNAHTLVVQVDTVLISGQERRRLILDNEDIWIQGVGSLQGFFRPIQECPIGCSIYDYSFFGSYNDEEGDPYEVYLDYGMAIRDRYPAKISLYPNPNSGSFMVEGMNSGKPYQVLDASGRVVFTDQFTGPYSHVELFHVEPGLYTLKCEAGMTRFVVR